MQMVDHDQSLGVVEHVSRLEAENSPTCPEVEAAAFETDAVQNALRGA